jgi:hypothetical protein
MDNPIYVPCTHDRARLHFALLFHCSTLTDPINNTQYHIQTTKMHIDPSTSKGLLICSLFGALAITLFWFLSFLLLSKVFGQPENAGMFGDSFGAINALFSGLAFLGVIVAIVLQRQELIEQRLEIRNSRIAQEESANALKQTVEDAKVRTELESLNLLIQSYTTLAESTRTASTLEEKRQHDEARAKLSKYQTRLFEKVNKIISSNEQSQKSI